MMMMAASGSIDKMRLFPILLFVFSCASSPASLLEVKIERVLQQRDYEAKFHSVVEFEEWWYLEPETHRHHLGRVDSVIVARLLSDHDTTLAGAAILVKSPESLRYIEPEIRQALDREEALRKETHGKSVVAISTGYPERDALLCLTQILELGTGERGYCELIDRYEGEVISKLIE